MKHIFVVNPGAGKGMTAPELDTKLKELEIEYEIYETVAAKDATRYVRERCESGEELRFYACGGDGTLKEVMEGTVGFSNASLSCYPVGSGNDFVKCFGGKERFLNLEKLSECMLLFSTDNTFLNEFFPYTFFIIQDLFLEIS